MAQPYHHGDLKAHLLQLARDQVRLTGAEALSLRELSRQAGVSHAAAYRHFPDKDDLLAALACEGFQALHTSCMSAMNEVMSDNAAHRLKACGEAYVEFGVAEPEMLALMWGGQRRFANSVPLQLAASALFELLVRAVTPLLRDSASDTKACQLLAKACWAMVHGYTTLMGQGVLNHGETEQSSKKSVSQGLEILIAGIVATQCASPACAP